MAAAAEVAGAGIDDVAVEGEDDVGEGEDGGHHDGSQRDDQIDNHADGQQCQKIEDGLGASQQAQDIIEHGDRQQEQSPYGT